MNAQGETVTPQQNDFATRFRCRPVDQLDVHTEPPSEMSHIPQRQYAPANRQRQRGGLRCRATSTSRVATIPSHLPISALTEDLDRLAAARENGAAGRLHFPAPTHAAPRHFPASADDAGVLRTLSHAALNSAPTFIFSAAPDHGSAFVPAPEIRKAGRETLGVSRHRRMRREAFAPSRKSLLRARAGARGNARALRRFSTSSRLRTYACTQ